jgi:hypothetical protein
VQQGARLGSTIKLYLADGQVGGIRVVQKDNWSGVGIDCARKDLPRARSHEEFEGSGVYVLSDFDDASGGLPRIYVGESEDLGARLATHAKKEDFGCGRLVIFTSKDATINKAHAKYLESRLCEVALAAKRSVLRNKNSPKAPKLSDSDRDQAEVFLREMTLVLPVLGITAFESAPTTPTPPAGRFELLGGTASGEGVETSEGFKVFAGAIANVLEKTSVSNATKQLRSDLTDNGALVAVDGGLKLTQDYVFSSPSSAASVLIASSVNGRVSWRLPDGRTLKDVQEEELGEFVDQT